MNIYIISVSNDGSERMNIYITTNEEKAYNRIKEIKFSDTIYFEIWEDSEENYLISGYYKNYYCNKWERNIGQVNERLEKLN